MIRKLKGTTLACILTLLGACAEESASSLIDMARSHIEQGQYGAAVIELKNALGKEPGIAEARLLLAQTYITLERPAEATKELLKAQEFGAYDSVVVPLLAETLLAQRRHDEVLSLPTEGLLDQGLAKVLAAKGLANLELKNTEEATALIDEALVVDSKLPFALVAKARLEMSDEEADAGQVRELVSKALKINPGFAPAWSLLGDIDRVELLYDAAEEDYSKAIKERTRNVPDRIKRALVRVILGRLDEAQQDVDVLLKLAPKHSGVHYAQGMIHFIEKDYEAALTSFELAEWEESNYPMTLLYSGISHYILRNSVQAELYATRFHSKMPKDMSGRKLLATVRLDQKEYEQVKDLIVPVIQADNKDIDALNLLANALLGQNDTESAVDILAKVVELEPDSASAQVRFGVGLLSGGRQVEGIERIEMAMELDPQYHQAEVMLILNYMREKDYDSAVIAAKSYQSRQPQDAAPFNMLGRVYFAAGDEQLAIDAFNNARKLSPGNKAACYNLGLLALKNKQLNEARSYYQEVLEYHKDDLTALVKLARLEALERNHELMLEYLDRAVEAHPKAVEPRVVLADYYLTQGRIDKMTLYLAELDKEQRESVPVLMLVARSKLAGGEFVEAQKILLHVVEVAPDFGRGHYELSKAYSALGNAEGMRRELVRASELLPGDMRPKLTLANLTLEEGHLSTVERQVGELKELDPEHPDVIQLEAMLAKRQGDNAEALKLLQKVFDLAPNTFTVIDLARQEIVMGHRAAAIELLEQWCSERPHDVSANLELANAYLAENRFDSAISTYKVVLSHDEDNLVALNNLAWHLRKTAPKEALDYARKVSRIAPDSAMVMDTLAMALLENGEHVEARLAIQRSLLLEPGNLSRQYHSALIDLAAEDETSAERTLLLLQDEQADFPERAEASALLKELSTQ